MKEDFLKYQAQTTKHPLALTISKADGCYIYDDSGKKYLDFIAGVSANTLGHNHSEITTAIKKQTEAYTHVMVYGEFIQESSVSLAKLLVKNLPDTLNSVYFTTSGTEAIEGALKLAKRVTGRHEIIAANKAYHGNTQGAMSICGTEEQISAFRPLIPGIRFIAYNDLGEIQKINKKTAAVVLETIQGGAGFILPTNDFLSKVKKRCTEVGALLILDEIQSGIGRTGRLFGFEHFEVVPDILVTGKGLGGGMPIGAFIASKSFMDHFTNEPKLGHITTFGGHPVITAAGYATLSTLLGSGIMSEVQKKEALIRKLLIHPLIKEIRGKGLMLAPILESEHIATKVILKCQQKGLLLFWLLYEPKAIRITPPLTISEDEIYEGCNKIIDVLNEILIDC